MPTCPKCGSPRASPLACPACKATFPVPLAFEDDPNPAASAVLVRDLDLDRRRSPRASGPVPAVEDPAWAAPTETPPPAPRPTRAAPASRAKPASTSSASKKPSATEGWLLPPDDEPAEAPPARPTPPAPPKPTSAAPRPTKPPPPTQTELPLGQAPTTAASPPAAAPAQPTANPRPAAARAPAPPRPPSAAPARSPTASPTLAAAAPQPAPVPVPGVVPPRTLTPPLTPPVTARTPAPEPPVTARTTAPEPPWSSPAEPAPPAPPPASPTSAQPHKSRLDDFPPQVPRAEPAAPTPPPEPSVSPAAAATASTAAFDLAFEAGVLRGAPAIVLEPDDEKPAPLAQPTEIHARPAGLLSRAVALSIDTLIVGAVLVACFGVARLIVGPPPAHDLAVSAWRGLLKPGIALGAALSFVYSTLSHALGGRTLGKRVLGVVLLDATGRPPRLARCAIRTLLVPLSFAPLFLGVLMALVGRNKQSLHDRLTRTYVVRLGR